MISNEMIVWQSQGNHRFCCEGDVVVFELHGLFYLEDALCMFRIADAQAQQHGYVLFLFDARDGLNVSQDARRLVSARLRTQPEDRATAIFGAGVAIRTLTRLFQNAGRLFGIPIKPIQFCDTLDEGRAWLDTQRQQFLCKLPRDPALRPGGAPKT